MAFAALFEPENAFDGADTDDDGEGGSFRAPANYLEYEGADPAALVEAFDSDINSRTKLNTAFTILDARSQDILQKRWLNDKKTTLQDLADTYNVSAERIRQLEKNAMNKLKTTMLAGDAA